MGFVLLSAVLFGFTIAHGRCCSFAGSAFDEAAVLCEGFPGSGRANTSALLSVQTLSEQAAIISQACRRRLFDCISKV